MATEARKRANLKYQSTRDRIVVWCKPEEKEKVKRKAAKAGKSVNEYCKERILGGD